MQLNEIVGSAIGGGTAALIAVMTLIQISPLKVNPWSFIGKLFGKIVRKFGRVINGELFDEINSLKEQINTLEGKMESVDTKIDGVETKVKDVREDISETKAIDCRTRILHFGDEVLHKQRHTKEHFDEVLRDIRTYDIYCKNHPEFPNHTTVLTSKRIIEIYEECLKNGDFL